MKQRIRTYEGASVKVVYDVPRCIHAAECVKQLGEVFDPDAHPWVNPDRAPAEDVVRVVLQCPTGALKFQRPDGTAEDAPPTNSVRLDPNGPLYVRGDVHITTPTGTAILSDTRLALCRCGASKNKPLCDGAHTEAGFDDPGALGTAPVETDPPATHGKLEVTVAANGPLLVNGTFTAIAADGTESTHSKAAWCRCGASANKPFCDGAHKRIGFSDGF
jgi:CDGSH-type Zn-finger protein/uncharacterized Fe-S cluster protein YjdI